jgi:hypothetical protein
LDDGASSLSLTLRRLGDGFESRHPVPDRGNIRCTPMPDTIIMAAG